VIYQDLVRSDRRGQSVNPAIEAFDASCFDGCYVTGDVTEAYLARLEGQRNGDIPMTPAPATRQWT
jgi:amidophosphoribosyltransferase